MVNAYLGALGAVVVASLAWAVLVWNSTVLYKWLKIKETEMFKMAAFYLVVNFVALWVVARFSLMFGFGVVSYVWVFALAFVANILQWLAWSMTRKK